LPEEPSATLLLVEDEAIIALNERQLLERNGFTVRVVHSGEEAVTEVMERCVPDLILMDIDLGSGMDGTEAARQIMSIRELPIVFLTSHTEPEYVERVKQITSYGYVLKSSGEFVLVQSIEMALELCAAHQETAREKERYRSVVENSNDALIIHDFQGFITFVNRQASRLLGYSEAELVGMSLDELHGPGFPERLERFVSEQNEQSTIVTEQELIAKTKERIPVEVSAVITSRDAPGEVQVFLRDIRHRKEAEWAFRAIYDQTEEAIAMLDREGRIVQINRAAARPFGKEPEELLGLTLADFHPPEPAERALAGIRAVFDSGKSRYNQWYTYMDGELRWYQVHSEPVTDANGFVNYVTTFGTEITELKQAEEHYRLIAEYAEDAVAVVDSDYSLIYLSPSVERVFGYSQEEVAEQGIFAMVHEEDLPELRRVSQEAVARGDTHGTREFRVVTRSGELRWAESKTRYIYTEQGELDRAVIVTRNITERKSLQEELQQTVRRLEEALTQNGHLLREMHHRVKNNLALVSSLIELKDSMIPEVDLSQLRLQVEAVRFVHEQLQSVGEMDAVDLKSYLEELLSQLFSSLSVYSSQLELDLESVHVAARKAVPIGLVVNELATNAVKHAGGSSPENRFRVALSARTGQLVLQVSNTGSRLPEDLDIHNAQSLGLQLIKGLVDQLQGALELTREPHPLFTITIPHE
jgi:PAS domain S-box-containing protein